jgi:hypothetical protein
VLISSNLTNAGAYTIEELVPAVFSTDHPLLTEAIPTPPAFLVKLSDEDKRKILWDNCARFYGAALQCADRAPATTQPQTRRNINPNRDRNITTNQRKRRMIDFIRKTRERSPRN